MLIIEQNQKSTAALLPTVRSDRGITPLKFREENTGAVGSPDTVRRMLVTEQYRVSTITHTYKDWKGRTQVHKSTLAMALALGMPSHADKVNHMEKAARNLGIVVNSRNTRTLNGKYQKPHQGKKETERRLKQQQKLLAKQPIPA